MPKLNGGRVIVGSLDVRVTADSVIKREIMPGVARLIHLLVVMRKASRNNESVRLASTKQSSYVALLVL